MVIMSQHVCTQTNTDRHKLTQIQTHTDTDADTHTHTDTHITYKPKFSVIHVHAWIF